MRSFISSGKVLFSLYIVTALTSCSLTENKEQRPEENRFTKVVLATNLDEPMQFEILHDGRVLFVERKGKVKVYDPANKQVSVIADFPVSVGYYSKTGEMVSPNGEDGMQGVALDPDFGQNHLIYLYYTPRDGTSSILARYKWEGDSLISDSKKVLLEVPNQRESCCHLGGGMVFDADGNLYLSTGDNTPNGRSGFPNIDTRLGMTINDSQRSSANTNDLRGKILRIHPEADGGYTIPKDNLFPVGTPKTLPEIYTMGNRNPYRLSIDSKTNYLYWGEIGPSGTVDSAGRGPKSYDEFNQARHAGNFGWPYAVGNNKAYWDYDFATNTPREKFDTAAPLNLSPNNTGLIKLPPSIPAMIWYPQTFSAEFPLLGTGSASAMGGPVFRTIDLARPLRPFPSYYEGKWFITDWIRGWIFAVSLDKNGNYDSMERFMPGLQIQGPNDMKFGPEGDLYVLQYGRGPYVLNNEAQLFKIEYNKGNRAPVARISANKHAGAVPLVISLSSEGTRDYDNDSLEFKWEIVSGGKIVNSVNRAHTEVDIAQAGIHQVRLIVNDNKGNLDSTSLEIVAGNEPPHVSFDFQGSNSTFYFPDSILHYTINVTDREDGNLDNNGVDSFAVTRKIDFLSQGLNAVVPTMMDDPSSEGLPIQFAAGLIQTSDCKSCHTIDKRAIGPSFMEISRKYANDTSAASFLQKKIRLGGAGVWGTMAMPAHTTITENDANKIVAYILGIGQEKTVKAIPLRGDYQTKMPAGEKGFSGCFIFQASYTDRGAASVPPQTSSVLAVFRNQVVPAIDMDILHEVDINPEITISRSGIVPKSPGSYFGIQRVDLTGIKQIEFSLSTIDGKTGSSPGLIEIRIDSPMGKLIGQTASIPAGANPALRIIAVISDIIGKHNIYFIVRGESGGNRMNIRNAKFSQNGAG